MSFSFKVPLLTCPYNIGTDASIFQYPLTIVKFFLKFSCCFWAHFKCSGKK